MIARVAPALDIHKPQDWPALLSTAQVGALLLVGRGMILRLIERGEMTGVRIGNRWRIPAEAVWPFVPKEIRARWPDEGPWRDPPPR
jgi:excisionase family DNA binding protein